MNQEWSFSDIGWKRRGARLARQSRKTKIFILHPSSFILLFVLLCLTSCQTLRHHFTEPAPDWQSRIGQLQYRGPKTSLIGEVLVRWSQTGDFELTFTKGPGVTLLTVRQDEKFVRVSGLLARGSWSGPPNETPARLRGWVSLRELLLHAPGQHLLHQTVGSDNFTFAF
jgi:hypothetical protein